MKSLAKLSEILRMKGSNSEPRDRRKVSRLSTAIVGAACMLSMNAHAGWSDWATVTGLHSNQGPARAFLIGPVLTGVCSNTWPVILFGTTAGTDNAKELYATALSAFMAGKEVRLYSETCWTGYPIILAMEIR